MNRDKTPHYFSVHFPGGAAHGVYSVVKAAYIEEQSGLYIRDLFTGGCRASSAGTFAAAAAFMPNKEDPTKPLYSMSEFVDVFCEKIPEFLPYRPFHHSKHALNHLTPFTKGLFNLHLSPEPMENGLKEILGDLKLKDATRTLSITTQEISPNWRPHDFTHIEEGYLEDRAKEMLDHPVQDLEMYKILMAATRFPTVFDSYTLKETGTTHIDLAFADGSADFISRCLRHRQDGQKFAHVILGTTIDSSTMSPELYRNMNAVSMMLNHRFFIRASGQQTRGRNLESLRGLLGSRNFYMLEDSLLPEDHPAGTTVPTTNILDTRRETMQRHVAFAQEQLEKHAALVYDPLIERLVRNHAVVHMAVPDAAFTIKDTEVETVDPETINATETPTLTTPKPQPRGRTLKIGPLEINISFNRAATKVPSALQDNHQPIVPPDGNTAEDLESAAQLEENRIEQDTPENTRMLFLPRKKDRAPK